MKELLSTCGRDLRTTVFFTSWWERVFRVGTIWSTISRHLSIKYKIYRKIDVPFFSLVWLQIAGLTWRAATGLNQVLVRFELGSWLIICVCHKFTDEIWKIRGDYWKLFRISRMIWLRVLIFSIQYYGYESEWYAIEMIN